MRIRQQPDAAAAILALCVFSAMDAAMPPAQEQVIATFQLSVVEYGWASAAQYLAIAISAPIIGRFGDVFDKRSVLAVALGLACAGGLLSIFATSVTLYMIAQVLLSAWVGAGTVAVALIAELAPPERQASGQGFFQGVTGLFSTAGLLGAGPAMHAMGTLSLFWLPALLALPCAIFLGRVLLQRPRHAQHKGLQQVDVGGGALLGSLLALLTIGLHFLPRGGWQSAAAVACLLLAALILPRWMRAQQRHASPFIDITLLARRNVACIHLVSLALGLGTAAIYFLLPMLISAASAAGAGYSGGAEVVSGLLLPIGVMGMLLMPLYAPLDRRLGARGTLALSMACTTASLVIPILWRSEIWPLLVCTMLFGIGLALTFTEGMTELLRIVPAERAAGASGTFTLAKTIGSMLGATGFSMALGADGEAGAVAGLAQLDLAFGLAALVCAGSILAVAGIGAHRPAPVCAE